jgi:hypothetical protein
VDSKRDNLTENITCQKCVTAIREIHTWIQIVTKSHIRIPNGVEQIIKADRFLTSKIKANNQVKSNMYMFEMIRGRRLNSTVLLLKRFMKNNNTLISTDYIQQADIFSEVRYSVSCRESMMGKLLGLVSEYPSRCLAADKQHCA